MNHTPLNLKILEWNYRIEEINKFVWGKWMSFCIGFTVLAAIYYAIRHILWHYGIG